jgi:hypothetical protein
MGLDGVDDDFGQKVDRGFLGEAVVASCDLIEVSIGGEPILLRIRCLRSAIEPLLPCNLVC